MKNILRSLFIAMICLTASTVSAADVTFTMSSIFDGTNQSAIVTTPTAATVSTNASKSNAKTGKLGSDGHYFEIVLASETYTAATINGFINTSDKSKNWAFQFSTDGGTNWSSEVTQANDGNKTAHDIAVGVTIPANANGFRVVRRAGTSTQVHSITLTLAGPAGPSNDATLSALVYGSGQTSVPNFSPEVEHYDVELPAGTTQVPNVAATANDSKATAAVTQASAVPGSASVKVTAEDGTTTKTYTITFTVASAYPKVLTATWANISGSAVIDQVSDPKTITGKVKNGTDLTAITPSFTGNNIASYLPEGAQNFSNGPVQYIFSASTGETTPYMVTITEAPAMSSDATLKSLTYGGTSVPNFSSGTYVYNIELSSGTQTPPTIAAVANDSKSQVVVNQASSVPGSGNVVVTAEDGTSLTYTVNFKVAVPQSGLTIHVPEIYEAKDIAGGYGGKLTVYNGREYEVYYINRDGDSKLDVATTNADKAGCISVSTGDASMKAKDGWFSIQAAGSGGDTGGSAQEEFGQSLRKVNVVSGNTLEFRVNGFDQFALYGKDNSTGGTKNLEVYINNVKQTMAPNNTYSIRRFSLTGESLIRVSAIGSSNNTVVAFSLRISEEPRTKWVKGNDSTQNVRQTTAMKPVYYYTKYNSKGQTRLIWDGAEATGISLSTFAQGPIGDTLVLGGTALCPVGSYKYHVVSYFNGEETSRVSGKLNVSSEIKSTSDINVTVYQNEEMDQITFNYYALSADDVTLTWSNGKPQGIEGSGINGKYIIGGTAADIGTYPYEITVLGADTVIKGVITVEKLDYGTNPVLYLYKNDEALKNDAVFTYLTGKGYNLIKRKTKIDGPRAADQYAKYNWVLISEDADANNAEVMAVTHGRSNLPVLNMKAFSYAHPIDTLVDTYGEPWGEPDNGSLTKENGRFITVQRDDHPIFKQLNKKKGDKIQVLDTVAKRGLMPISIKKQGSLCLATAWTRDINDYNADGIEETFLHEIQADQRNGQKYICLPLAISSSPYLTKDGKDLISAIVTYLTNSLPTVQIPDLRIEKCIIEGIEGVIDEQEQTITFSFERSDYLSRDFTAVVPAVTLADQQLKKYLHTNPAEGEAMDLSTSDIRPVPFVVTDYINRRVYNIIIRSYSIEGIDEVYTAGEWVNVYDIFGRKVATTNEDVYTMPLPRGVYIIVTETGQTIKIMR